MWILIIIALNLHNPTDIPGKVSIPMESEAQCNKAKEGMTYWLKFDSFKITATCEKAK